MMRRALILAVLTALGLSACDQKADAQPKAPLPLQADAQDGQGEPYQVPGTEVWTVPDRLSGRTYQVYVALPPSYATSPDRTYPVLYVTDAHYAFPVIRQLARRMNLDEPVIAEHILVGLSYAQGDDGMISRTRDYTPSARPTAKPGTEGGGPAYQDWLKTSALPFIDSKYRTDPAQRLLLGHSFGGLLASQILFSDPDLFSGYVLGSPSLWFNGREIFQREANYAANHRDLDANVFMYIGEKETPSGTKGNRYDMVADNARMATALTSRNYPNLEIDKLVVEGEDHLTVAPIGFMRALEALLPASSDQ